VCTLHSVYFLPQIFSLTTALQFTSAVKYLGLLLDSKLLWGCNFRWLSVKCEQLLNILKVLSGRFWGRDWTGMLYMA
jgi:hypothetical protein